MRYVRSNSTLTATAAALLSVLATRATSATWLVTPLAMENSHPVSLCTMPLGSAAIVVPSTSTAIAGSIF